MTTSELQEFRQNYPFTYVDAGARWGPKSNLLTLFPSSKWVGFEPDPTECALVNSKAQAGWRCFPLALGPAHGSQPLYVTRSADWNSLYEPDPQVFSQFNGLEDFHYVEHQCQVPVTSLDKLAFSDPHLLGNADYLKLDVQGAEADVLQGAKTLLAKSLVAVEVEVEFLPLYKRQPLFDQIHAMMMDNGFLLFDLTRNRCIRSGFTADIETRGQLIWGDALYLKDFRSLLLEQTRYHKLLALLLVAKELGFPDYSLSVLDGMLTSGVANNNLGLEVYQAVTDLRMTQRRKTRLVDTVARVPYGRQLLRRLRQAIDNNYGRIVSLSYPEYYFRRG